jgi:hypothetical protein
MTYENIVLESADQIDSRTSHEIAAAQLRGEARVPGRNPRQVVRAIAAELHGLGLRPNLRELARRYEAGGSTPSTWLREGGAARG